jgi:hypothetical protein
MSTGYSDAYRSNGVLRGTGNATDTLPPLTINAGQLFATEPSVWQVAETIIFDRKLSLAEIQKVEDYLAATYGISGYSNQQSYSESVTVNASAGSVTLSDTYSATLGYRNIFTVSPSIPGITLENTATNSVRIRIASTVSAGTYWETITARDGAGNTALLPVRIEVVPALQWSASNPSSFTTTFGKNSRLRLDLSGGFGTRLAAVAHVSSPAPRGITLDVSTISSGFINFVVDTGTAIGTYTESITVTDGSGLIKTTILTLTINSPPDIGYSAQSDAAFPYVTQNLLLNLDVANPNSYSGTGTTWTDTVGNRAFTLSGSPTFSQANGGTLAFATGKEATSNTNWTNLDTFTVETWFKLKSLSTVAPCFVTSTYASSHINFAICQWNAQGSMFAGYHVGGSGWQAVVGGSNLLTTNTWYHAVYTVSKVGTTYTGTLYLNGVSLGSATSELAPQTNAGPLRVGKRWDGTTEYVDGEIPVVRIYRAPLTAQQVRQNFQNSKVRFVSATSVSPTNSGNTTLTATAGTARDFELFTATDGVGNKTLSLSGTNSNFRIDTSTANTAIFKVLSSATSTNASTARTYSETLTAVDTNGIATAYYLSVAVSPALLITTTSDTVTTTFGRNGSTTLNVAANTGTGVSTFSRVSSSGSSAITATLTSGQAILNVAATLPAGTYFETFTATDSVGATAVKVIRIVVNAALAIVPDSGVNSIDTTFTRATTARLNITGGTGNRTYAITYPVSASRWRITLDTSTAASNFVTVRMDSFTATGTHSLTITVTDSLSATASTTLTLNVNEFPILNNVKNDNSYVKPGLVLNLDAANPLSSTGAGNWKDLSGAGSSAVFTSAPTYSATNGGIFNFNGIANYLTFPSITTANSPGVTNGAFTEYTAETWVKFTSPTFSSFSGTACLICEGYTGTTGSINLALSLRNNGQIHSGYLPTTNQGWVEVVSSVGTVTTGNWYHIASTVVKSGNNYINTIYLNGVAITSATSTLAPASSSRDYFIGRRWDAANQLLNGSIGVVRVYNRGLSQSEIQDNYSALSSRYINTSARSSTLATTQGTGASSSSIPATLGTGNKTLTLTPIIAGITADTSTANAIRVSSISTLAATDTQTARTYFETVTATDATGVSVTHLVNVIVNPPIIETSTAPILTNIGGVITHVLTTTSGIETSTVIYATKGSSAKTFSRVGTSTSGVSLTPNGDQATLRVLTTINPGTYWETITATDTTSAMTNLVFKIVVNPGPTIVGRNTLTATTSTAFTSVGYYVANGTGALKLTMSPTISGITLDTSTAGVAFIKLTNAFTSAGTYLETLTVTDANGATGRLLVTIKVVGPVELSGATTVSSVYGDSNLFSYNVSGGGIAKFNVMVGSSCITSKSTYSSNGTTYTVEQLTGSNSANTCSWVVPAGVTSVTGLVIAGGGQGGAGRGGGGGSGAVETGTITVTPGETLTVRIGVGGSNASCSSANSPAGCDGTDTIIDRTGTPNYIVAKGGGGGGGHLANSSGRAGGSGGGAGMNYASTSPEGGSVLTNTVPSGWTAYGNMGVATSDTETAPTKYRNTGGGGGAGSPGFPGVCKDKSPVCNDAGTAGGFQPDGGEGLSISITGSPVVYAGGGGGAVSISVTEAGTGSYLSAQPGNYRASGAMASKGGAGIGASPTSPEGTKATPNTGSGGGGSITGAGGNGASGLVVFRYVTPTAAQPNNRISFDLVDATTGRFNMTVPESITVGSYTQSVYLTDANDAGSIYRTATITVNVIQDTPTVTVTLPGAVTTAKYGTPVTLSAVASTNGNINFRKNGTTITNCGSVLTSGGLASCSWTPTMVETTTITAELTPTDSLNYRNSIEIDSLLTVVVGKADTLTITANTPGAITYSSPITLPTNGYTTSGLRAIDTITAMSYSYSVISGGSCANGGECSVGDIGPAGGVVFYVSPTIINTATGISSGGRYLEAAPSSTSTTYNWCNNTTTFLNANASGIGAGAETTRVIAAACTSGAAKTAANLTQGGYTDWFLPSFSEFIEMSKFYSQIGMSGGTYYWASSEYDSTFGYGHAPSQSEPATALKSASLRIWPIRAFTTGVMTGSPTDAGTYYIYPTNPTFNPGAASNYISIEYTPGTLVINKAPRSTWSATYNAGTNATRYGASKTETATVTYPGDGTKLFTTNSSACSVGPETGTITTTGVGTCTLQVSLSETKNWLPDTKTVTVTIDRGLRSATLTPAKTTIKYGETSTVTSTISPELDSATVIFSTGTFLGCVTDNITGEITGVRAGASCAVSVTYGQTDLYESATASAAITINKALAPVVTTETITAVSYTGNAAIVVPTYRVTGILARDILQVLPTADVSDISLINPSTYSAIATYKYFATTPTSYDSTTAPTLGGTYSVTPQTLTLLSGVDIGNYETPTYVSSNLVILPIAQSVLRILLSAQESITVPYEVTISGGSSTGLLTLAIVPGGSASGCSISVLNLRTSSPGTCVLQATKGADRNYLQALSETATVTILNFVSNINWDGAFNGGTGITIASSTPIITGPDSCSVDCVPEITDIQDASGNSTNVLTVGAPLRIIGVDLNGTLYVYFTARINGSRLSNVPAESFQIDSSTQLTVMPPTNFIPNNGENSSNIAVRIIVVTSGGRYINEKIARITL